MADIYEKVGSIDEIPRQGARAIQTSNGEIAIIRTLDDQVFAIDNQCPHKKGPLADGIIHGHNVTCPLHNWVFDLKEGKAKYPDEGSIGCYAVKLEEKDIFVQVRKS